MSEFIRPPDNWHIESKENTFAHDEWAGGFFDTGGTFYFDRQFKRNGTPNVIPVISYRDDSDERVATLQDILRGSVNEQSQKWSVRNTEAVSLARKIQEFAPARQFHIDIFSDILEVPHSERLEIANRQREAPRFLDVAPDAYQDLVSNPKFLAGVYDSHGSLQFNEDGDPLINISTQNRALLDAVQNQYGGSVITEVKKRTDSPSARRVRQPATSYRLVMSNSQVENFFDFTSDNILLREADLLTFDQQLSHAA
jgi:hypothetical protein